MGNLKYTSDDHNSYSCDGWFIIYHLPFTIDNMYGSPFDIEKTKNSKSIKCFCDSGCSDVEWSTIMEWEIYDCPNIFLFKTKEEALEKFHKLVKAYGRGLKFEDIFVSIHHCVVERNVKIT